jgi:hypothetical protein
MEIAALIRQCSGLVSLLMGWNFIEYGLEHQMNILIVVGGVVMVTGVLPIAVFAIVNRYRTQSKQS